MLKKLIKLKKVTLNQVKLDPKFTDSIQFSSYLPK